MIMHLLKAHAYGNDFLLAEEPDDPAFDAAGFARRVCERHRGIGADGLILYRPTEAGATMRLLNADGSYSEISGNGLRCLAALLAGRAPGRDVLVIETDAGAKRLRLVERTGARLTFRAAMGAPEALQPLTLETRAGPLRVATLRVGNPQCVMLVDQAALTEQTLHRLGPVLTSHPQFPQGTNVEFAWVEDPGQVRILIWERGVGPTEASGTGACASAVVAAAFGGAGRDVQVTSPGGTQRVEWREDGLYLTGWAELVCDARWLADMR
jgi:diaminopimelate epimerase